MFHREVRTFQYNAIDTTRLENSNDFAVRDFGGYVTSSKLRGPVGDYVMAPAFGQDAGLIGAIALAMEAEQNAGS